jgi:hypothetical protein
MLSLNWKKSIYSFSNGNCTEVRETEDGHVQVRDSKNPDGPVLTFTPVGWDTFLRGVRLGEFDRSL